MQPFPPHRFVSVSGYCLPSLPYRPLPSTLRDPCSACLLPTVHLGNTASHSNRSYTLPGGSRQQAEGFALEQFHDPPFLPRTIAYTAEQVHQQTPGRSHPHNGVGIRIRSSTLPRTIAFTATQQVHQQTSGRSHPHITVGRYGLGDKGDGSYLAKGRSYPDRTRSPPKAIGILAYNRQCSGAALPRRRHEGDSIAVRRLSGRSQGGSYATKLAIHSRPTADDCAIAGPPTEAWKVE